MKQSWIRFLWIFLLMLLPLMLTIALGFLLPPCFEKTFLGELDHKVDRLHSVSSPKVIVISGSSAAFSVDPKQMEEMLGMPVVNFGLYATIGTKAMCDLSRADIGKGDIIVIAPELNTQTWSLYFNAETMWQAADGHFSLLSRLDGDDIPAMLGGFWRFTASKIHYLASGEALDPEGIYNAAAFDEYGFIRYRRDRDYNIMDGGYQFGMKIAFDPSLISADFIDYVNEYADYAKRRGASVYLGFCPMNEAALDPSTTLESLSEFTAYLKANFHCEVLGDPNEYLYRSGYFYDSNFHTNSAGAILHSSRLSTDLAGALGRELLVRYDTPAIPEIPDEPDEPEVYDYDPNEVYYTFDATASGVIVTGVSELGKKQSVLTTPMAYDGKKVTLFAENAFADCPLLTELTVTKNISQLTDGMFNGADNLTSIHLLSEDPNDCTANNVSGRTTEGLPPSARFYVPASSYQAYVSNYFWGAYTNYLAPEK